MRKIAVQGGQLDASFINELSALVYRWQSMSAQAPLELNLIGGSPSIRFVDPSITVMIDETGTGINYPFSWSEVQPDGIGGWDEKPGGRTGTPDGNPAYERNGKSVRVGTIVDIKPGLTSEYVFDVGPNGPAKFIVFTLPSALLVTDASLASCPVTDYWQGADPGSTVTLYNPPASGDYIFAAASGSKGLATYDDRSNKYYIIQIQC